MFTLCSQPNNDMMILQTCEYELEKSCDLMAQILDDVEPQTRCWVMQASTNIPRQRYIFIYIYVWKQKP